MVWEGSITPPNYPNACRVSVHAPKIRIQPQPSLYFQFSRVDRTDFCLCDHLATPSSPSTVGFLPLFPQIMDIKEKEVLGGLEKRLAIALTCRSRALEEKAGMWQERMGHQKGALLFLSSSGQSQPG